MLDSSDRGTGRRLRMTRQAAPYTSEATATQALAQAIGRFAETDGDHTTAIPALTLHRRKAPTEPLHCIYNLGLGVVAQGDKQVLLGGESIDYGPGQSMLTTIALPVISHVTGASTREPFLGMMVTLDARSILQIASEMDEPRPRREHACRAISFEALDGPCSKHSSGSSGCWASQHWFAAWRRSSSRKSPFAC
jgi:hypothetical protein